MELLKIHAVMWTLGCSEEKAKEYIANVGSDILAMIVNGYKNEYTREMNYNA